MAELPDPAHHVSSATDRLAPARGVLLGIALALTFWLTLLGMILLLTTTPAEAITFTCKGHVGIVTVCNGTSGPDSIYGEAGSYQHQLWGNGSGDSLFGRGGADDLHGGDGADWLDGGTGYDRCWGGPGPDRFSGCDYIGG